MTKNWIGALACCALLTACGTNAVIADLEEDKAIVEMTGTDYAVADAEARQGCQLHGKVPVRISERCIGQYCLTKQVLYACKPPNTDAASMAPKADPAPLASIPRTDTTMASSAYTPLPPGTPAPYEGVRMSSFSAEDMRWFCSQPWQQRPAPTGRTEYNPCHVSEAFTR